MQQNAGRPNRNFPLDLFEDMNPTFTEGLSKYLPISQTCQEVQMKIFAFSTALLLPAYIHLALGDKVMHKWCFQVDLCAFRRYMQSLN